MQPHAWAARPHRQVTGLRQGGGAVRADRPAVTRSSSRASTASPPAGTAIRPAQTGHDPEGFSWRSATPAVRPAGVEPASPSFGGMVSVLLRYRRLVLLLNIILPGHDGGWLSSHYYRADLPAFLAGMLENHSGRLRDRDARLLRL